MKKIIILALFVVCSSALKAQTTSEITAEGKSKIKVKPDQVTLKLDIRKVNEIESEAIKELNLEMDILQKFLSKSGVPSSNIKISDFSVNSNTRYNSNLDKKLFTAHASLLIETKLDYKFLDAIYTEIQSGKYKDVNINYTTSLSDSLQSKTQNTLLQMVIADAKQNAAQIAEMLDVKIIGVKSVSKNGKMISPLGEADNMVYNSASLEVAPTTIFTKFEVTEKEIEERIIIIFEISK